MKKAEKVKVDKLGCQYPLSFTAMWWATFLWLTISIANVWGMWLSPRRMDSVGVNVVLLFTACIAVSFWDSAKYLIPRKQVAAEIDHRKKWFFAAFIIVFATRFTFSILAICTSGASSVADNNRMVLRNVPLDTAWHVVADVAFAFVICLFFLLAYLLLWLISVHFSGRIRRITAEAMLAIAVAGYLSVAPSDDWLIRLSVVLIATAFLYDIWLLADFSASPSLSRRIKDLLDDCDKDI